MAKATKVSSDDESDHANASDSDSDDDDEPTKDELITMLEDCKYHFKESRKKCKALRKDKQTLMQELDEIRVSYESLKEDHKKLQKSHTKLGEAHSCSVDKYESMPTNIEKFKTCNIGISCDIIDESFYKPIVVVPTNPSCSTSTSSSSSSDGFTYDSSRE
jgi:hypothetical protein